MSVVTQPTHEGISHYVLSYLLSDGYTLALNARLGTLSLMVNGVPIPRMVTEQQFTASEMSLLLPLMDNHPHYCPYEVMYASFYNGVVTETTIAQSRKRLDKAAQEDIAWKEKTGKTRKYGAWDVQMRPLRNVLSRIRFKLRHFGIDIKYIDETGYCLLPLPTSKKTDSPLS